ncbi:TetR/AcrR family transcriptional regulator [Motiliproteus sp.]|uniref:TetR/AcrR family transcriptional regulator n=1 Tax=Motiliproteus sp. TaxID=1898955 RepID=UPI003BADA5F2
MTATDTKNSYHHGDLHASLLKAATAIIAEAGVEGLSMRKLADRVGVSRTAPYHHFRDKQALLSELAISGFREFTTEVDSIAANDQLDAGAKLEAFVRFYLKFAMGQPEVYNLMFGQSIWKSGEPSQHLIEEGHAAFRRFVELVEQWQLEGTIPSGCEPLRYAQVAWSSLHGLCRLAIDGIYADASSVDAVSDTLIQLLRQQLGAGAEPV